MGVYVSYLPGAFLKTTLQINSIKVKVIGYESGDSPVLNFRKNICLCISNAEML